MRFIREDLTPQWARVSKRVSAPRLNPSRRRYNNVVSRFVEHGRGRHGRGGRPRGVPFGPRVAQVKGMRSPAKGAPRGAPNRASSRLLCHAMVEPVVTYEHGTLTMPPRLRARFDRSIGMLNDWIVDPMRVGPTRRSSAAWEQRRRGRGDPFVGEDEPSSHRPLP